MTTVHPAAIAGATLIAIEPALEFHGVNMPTTPTGSRTTLEFPTVLTRSKLLRTSLKCKKMFAARLLEPFARSCGAPYSMTVASMRASIRLATDSCNFCRHSIRYSLLLCEKPLNASFAAAMAFCVSRLQHRLPMRRVAPENDAGIGGRANRDLRSDPHGLAPTRKACGRIPRRWVRAR